MDEYQLLCIRERPELQAQAAAWFHQKWNIPQAAYAESIAACLQDEDAVPQWYLVLCGEQIVAGLGVIENDFHPRKDLRPNICAVYVDEAHRCRGLAGRMLERVCDDCKAMGINTLYLLTSHSSFYERYGWRFMGMTPCDDESALCRLYVHTA